MTLQFSKIGNEILNRRQSCGCLSFGRLQAYAAYKCYQLKAKSKECYLRGNHVSHVSHISRCPNHSRTACLTQCSKNCGGGVKSREVQCFDMRDHRPLRPFHCRATSSRPQAQLPCNSQPCLDWYASSWGQVSQNYIN